MVLVDSLVDIRVNIPPSFFKEAISSLFITNKSLSVLSFNVKIFPFIVLFVNWQFLISQLELNELIILLTELFSIVLLIFSLISTNEFTIVRLELLVSQNVKVFLLIIKLNLPSFISIIEPPLILNP